MGDDFDAIVVGAGMAGGSAAIRLAQGGANVLLLERGAEAGAKNLSGGVLWGHDLDRILPNWADRDAARTAPRPQAVRIPHPRQCDLLRF